MKSETRASDALWAGLPVITKVGEGFSARVAASLLSAAGLPELITYNAQEYEARALELATNADQLSLIKRKLAQNRMTEPLFNTKLYTRHLEQAFEKAYQRYLDRKSPDTIYVQP